MRYAILAVFLLAGCARYMGVGAPTPEFSRSYGCDHDAIMTVRKATTGHTRPQIGWTACNVLAYWGMPTDVTVHETQYGRTATWWFPDEGLGTPYTHTLTVRQRESAWIVDYIAW